MSAMIFQTQSFSDILPWDFALSVKEVISYSSSALSDIPAKTVLICWSLSRLTFATSKLSLISISASCRSSSSLYNVQHIFNIVLIQFRRFVSHFLDFCTLILDKKDSKAFMTTTIELVSLSNACRYICNTMVR